MFNSNDLSQESLCLTHLLLCESRKVIRVTKLTHPAQATLLAKQWKKEQASRCCTTDVWLHQFVNQLYNNQKRGKLVFSTACYSHCQPNRQGEAVLGLVGARDRGVRHGGVETRRDFHEAIGGGLADDRQPAPLEPGYLKCILKTFFLAQIPLFHEQSLAKVSSFSSFLLLYS